MINSFKNERKNFGAFIQTIFNVIPPLSASGKKNEPDQKKNNADKDAPYRKGQAGKNKYRTDDQKQPA
ncbi:MAG: hypothetical protein IJ973_06580 [Christensenellaceae bacterium]|nr:hypothetical protein [Christensenellaceae bacterium]